MSTMSTTDCPACEGLGSVYVQARPASWYDDGVESAACGDCGGSGQVEPSPLPTATRADFDRALLGRCMTCQGSARCLGGECFYCFSDRREERIERPAHDTIPCPPPPEAA
jgi:Zn ribbon nucleic-acid-binding protein